MKPSSSFVRVALVLCLALPLAVVFASERSAEAQACASADGIQCDNPGAACSPPTGGTCKQGLRCKCRASLSPEQQACQRSIGKAYAKLAATLLKIEEKCEDRLVRGDTCDTADAQQDVAAALQKAQERAMVACTGVDLGPLVPAGCAVDPSGMPNPLASAIQCLSATHIELAAGMSSDAYGASTLIRCCISGVCVKSNASNCASAGGTNIGAGSCNPDPC